MLADPTDFRYSDLLPVGPDRATYRLLTTDDVSTFEAADRVFLRVSPAAIERLTSEAMQDIAHPLGPARPSQPGNRRQDGGTAIVVGRKSEGVLTGADDGEAISRGVFDAHTQLNLRSNLRAQIELYAVEDPVSSAGARRPEYTFLFIAKVSHSSHASRLFQETKAVLSPTRFLQFLDARLRSLGPAPLAPYHLAVVIGGTSAEFALKTATYASVHQLDGLPTAGTMAAHGFRDLELEEQVFELTQSLGNGSVCLDVRVVRLPRHAGSCPIAIAVASPADRHTLGKITADGVFLAQSDAGGAP